MVEDYFFAERPMADIAVELGVTDSRISQMCAEALTLLRDALHLALDPALVKREGEPGGIAQRRRESYHTAVAARHAADMRRNIRRPLDAVS